VVSNGGPLSSERIGKVLLFEGFKNNILDNLAPGFRNAGFETHLVYSVDECLQSVRTVKPDVVLMITNNIQEKRAFAAAEAIRSLHPTCGFVFLAGSEEDGREGFLAAGYKFKVHETPITYKELMALTSEAMESPLATFVAPGAAKASSHG